MSSPASPSAGAQQCRKTTASQPGRPAAEQHKPRLMLARCTLHTPSAPSADASCSAAELTCPATLCPARPLPAPAVQNGLAEAVQKSRKQIKERKNRSKPLRGVKKAGGERASGLGLLLRGGSRTGSGGPGRQRGECRVAQGRWFGRFEDWQGLDLIWEVCRQQLLRATAVSS